MCVLYCIAFKCVCLRVCVTIILYTWWWCSCSVFGIILKSLPLSFVYSVLALFYQAQLNRLDHFVCGLSSSTARWFLQSVLQTRIVLSMPTSPPIIACCAAAGRFPLREVFRSCANPSHAQMYSYCRNDIDPFDSSSRFSYHFSLVYALRWPPETVSNRIYFGRNNLFAHVKRMDKSSHQFYRYITTIYLYLVQIAYHKNIPFLRVSLSSLFLPFPLPYRDYWTRHHL